MWSSCVPFATSASRPTRKWLHINSKSTKSSQKWLFCRLFDDLTQSTSGIVTTAEKYVNKQLLTLPFFLHFPRKSSSSDPLILKMVQKSKLECTNQNQSIIIYIEIYLKIVKKSNLHMWRIKTIIFTFLLTDDLTRHPEMKTRFCPNNFHFGRISSKMARQSCQMSRA